MIEPFRRKPLFAIAALSLAAPSLAAAPPDKPSRKPDAAELVSGTYAGDVISDSQGSSKQGVTLTLTRVGPNRVAIASDYPRLPAVTVDVERAMNSIVQHTGDTAFSYDIAKKHLDVSFHNEVSWSGDKQ